MDTWTLIEPYRSKVDIYRGPAEFLRTLKKVPPEVGLLIATEWCQSEVRNGGFHQFFSNSTGVLAPEAAVGFAAMKLPRVAKLVKKAMAFFGRSYPRKRELRLKKLARLYVEDADRSEWDPFYALDQKLYAAALNYEAAADAYAARYAASLDEEEPVARKKRR